jgi:hypothetical protein
MGFIAPNTLNHCLRHFFGCVGGEWDGNITTREISRTIEEVRFGSNRINQRKISKVLIFKTIGIFKSVKGSFGSSVKCVALIWLLLTLLRRSSLRNIHDQYLVLSFSGMNISDQKHLLGKSFQFVANRVCR